MKKSDPRYEQTVLLLREELIPAMGCTEPAAIAYAAALAARALGETPESCRLTVSGNVVKNAKSVSVPNAGGRKGLQTAAAAGVVCGDPDAGLEVLSCVKPAALSAVDAFVPAVTVLPWDGDKVFYIEAEVFGGGHSAKAVLEDDHTNLTLLSRDGVVLTPGGTKTAGPKPGREALTLEAVYDFADTFDTDDLREPLMRQRDWNLAIAREGMANPWGACIGRTLMQAHPGDGDTQLRAMAAAGSDARMSGCELPVIILSGSGNQGITASVPVAVCAERLGAQEEKTLRALALADLVTLFQKQGIGCLSAYCGAVSAGCGAAAGVAYLHGGGFDVIAHTVVNAVAILSGMVCDGAKPSCAAKIAAAVDAGLLGWHMYQNGGCQFYGGEGIVVKGADNTIANVGRLAREGMRDTDREIIRIMTGG